MNLYDIPFFGTLRVKMDWLNDRQTVLAENVANSSTANYKARDLKDLSFDEMIERSQRVAIEQAVSAKQVRVGSKYAEFSIEPAHDGEMTPNGNSVILEEQMMKVAETESQFRAAIDIYQRGLSILRMAVRGQ